MSFLRKILGYRDFNTLSSIKEYLSSENLVSDAETSSLKHLILFKTSKQTTWLLSDSQFVFCFLDDTGKDNFELRWKETKNRLEMNFKITWDYKPNTAKIDFGENHKRWLVTKSLFRNQQKLNEEIKKIIS